MHQFALVTTDREALGVFAYAKGDWKRATSSAWQREPPHRENVVSPEPRGSDDVPVGMLIVEPGAR